MKKYQLLFCAIIFCNFTGFAQTNDAKRDNIWILGYGGEGPTKDTFFSNMRIDFSQKPIEAQKLATVMNIRSDVAMISDTSGKLLFYTNGIYIADKTHQTMKNGSGLNPGKFATSEEKYGAICGQGALILPKPDNPNIYYLIHNSTIYNANMVKGERLYYTIVDMSLNNEKGEVTEKNKILLDTFVDYGKITACRHANGNDWWIIVTDFDTKKYNIFLLSPQGITLKEKLTFPKGFKGGVGQAVFSPDGTKYARFNAYSIDDGTYVDIFDFDRCSGKLSNQKHWNYTTDTTYSGGIAISPNSKYLYVMSFRKIYQFDLTANDIFSTLDTVAIHDGVTDGGFSTNFYLAQLAPDNKIYITIPSTSSYYHVIEYPDKKGKACSVKQRGFKLPTYNYTTIPNFPNFRLGKAATQCITSSEEITEKINLKIYPNPTNDNLHLEYDKEKMQDSQLIISDLQGRKVVQKTLNEDNIDVHTFSKGIYFLQILKENKVIFRQKVVIIN
jgi:DNA-binding beta-propeller fold protein YncE